MFKGNDYWSKDFMDLFTKMVDVFDRRIDMNGIKSHPWYTNNDVPTLK